MWTKDIMYISAFLLRSDCIMITELTVTVRSVQSIPKHPCTEFAEIKSKV